MRVLKNSSLPWDFWMPTHGTFQTTFMDAGFLDFPVHLMGPLGPVHRRRQCHRVLLRLRRPILSVRNFTELVTIRLLLLPTSKSIGKKE
ncbi:hypothetical protein ACFX2I_012570 [Malus domestica]